jgi:hypothetical protein
MDTGVRLPDHCDLAVRIFFQDISHKIKLIIKREISNRNSEMFVARSQDIRILSGMLAEIAGNEWT